MLLIMGEAGRGPGREYARIFVFKNELVKAML